MMKQAVVFFQDRRAGILTEDENGYTFAYDTDYLAAPVVAPIRASTKDNCGVCFDLKSNRFITIGTWGELVAPVSAGGAFNTGAIDPTFKYEYMNEGKDGETCLIMTKDGESPTFLQPRYKFLAFSLAFSACRISPS